MALYLTKSSEISKDFWKENKGKIRIFKLNIGWWFYLKHLDFFGKWNEKFLLNLKDNDYLLVALRGIRILNRVIGKLEIAVETTTIKLRK